MVKVLNRESIKRIAGARKSASGTESGGGGGGAVQGPQTLEELSDTNISDPANGDVRVYNSTTEMWENKEKAPKAVHADKADEVPWKGVKDVITDNNEFNICDTTPPSNNFWFNYRGRQGDNLSSSISEYNFGNGRGSRSGTTVRAENFFADSAVSVVSDARKKIVTDDQAVIDLDAIAEAPAVRFKWRDSDGETEHIGTIAQYWQRIMPEVVSSDKDGNLSMQYGTAALVAVVSLAREVRQLKEIIKAHGLS